MAFSLNMSSLTSTKTVTTDDSDAVATTIDPSTLATATVSVAATTDTNPVVSTISVGSTTVTRIPQLVSNTITINGQKINRKTDSTKYNVMKGTAQLVSNNSATYEETNDISLETINFFAALGCAVLSPPTADYTLIDEQTDTTSLTNPSIKVKSPSVKNKEGKAALSTLSSFSSVDDPFYEVDTNTLMSSVTSVIDAVVASVEVGSNAVSLASDIATINTNSEYTSTLKQFQATETSTESTSTTSKISTTFGLK